VNNKLDRMWKEAVVVQCKVLSRGLSGRTEENRDILSQDNRSPGGDSNPRAPEYEVDVF
jgi:hypothetical protein